MHNNDCQSPLAISLPMTLAQHADARLNFNQALLVWRQDESPPEQVTGDGLRMASAQEPFGNELGGNSSRSGHRLILNGVGGRNRMAET